MKTIKLEDAPQSTVISAEILFGLYVIINERK